MENYPTNPIEVPENAQDVQPGGGEALQSLEMAAARSAEIGAAAMAAAGEQPAAVAQTEAMGQPEVAGQSAVERVVPEMPMQTAATAAEALTPAPNLTEALTQTVTPAAPEAMVASDAAAAPEALKMPEADKNSDDSMVQYIIGRLQEDLTAPAVQGETPEAKAKGEQIRNSIVLFGRVGFELEDDKSQGKEPETVEKILGKIGREQGYLAKKTQDAGESDRYNRMAALANEWAESYEQRKAKRAAEEANGGAANAAEMTNVANTTETAGVTETTNTAEAGSPGEALNNVAAAMAAALAETPEASAASEASEATGGAAPQVEMTANNVPVGTGAETTKNMVATTPANAGETTPPLAVSFTTGEAA